jgi:hypothetical protein
MKALFLLLTLTCLFTLTACGGGSGGGNEDSDTDTGGGEGGGGEVGIPTVLEGTWRKACGPMDSLFPDDGYDIVTITVTINQFSSNIENYLDAACSQPDPDLPNPTASGSLSVGADVMTTNGVTATEVDTEITRSSNPDVFVEETYDIFYIDGDNLYFGEFEADVPEDRDDTLDFNRVFVRQ